MLNWADFHGRFDAPKKYKSMADIKMNEFTPTADSAHIYGEAADGSQVKIRIETLFAKIATGQNIPDGLTINDHRVPGVWIVSGEATAGLSDTSGVLVNLWSEEITCQCLLTMDCMAFRRSDGSWNKVTFTPVE